MSAEYHRTARIRAVSVESMLRDIQPDRGNL